MSGEIDEEEFHDAVDSVAPASSMDLETAVEACKLAVNLFFNNKFTEARELLKPWAHESMYHALGYGTIMFMQAVMTFEQSHIASANEVISSAIEVCSKCRRKITISQSLGKIVKKPNYDTYTEEEIHAELCYGECLLIKSLLTFMEDETLMSFVKGALKIKSCFHAYKECYNILKQRNWENDKMKIHFESGVRMGVGVYHVMISMLPGKILKLLEFIGFHGNRYYKDYGLRELETGANLKGSVRQILCSMVLLNYHLVIAYVLSYGEGDIQKAEEILSCEMKKYPQGAWFLFLRGRLDVVKGEFENAIMWFTRSWQAQSEWTQFHHICFWELTWSNCALQQWPAARDFSDRLLQHSKWSRTIYSYQKACMMIMMKDSLTEIQKDEIDRLMSTLPQFKHKIAGKSLPMEKFVIKKSERYFAQKKHLVLPALELLYVWNAFKFMGKNDAVIQSWYLLIERTLADLEKNKGGDFYADNRALLLLTKGMCLKYLHSPLQAEECFSAVLEDQRKIREDLYLVPYSLVELALLVWDQGQREQAKSYLEAAKSNYSRYTLENRLHFRIHSALADLQENKPESTESANFEEVTTL